MDLEKIDSLKKRAIRGMVSSSPFRELLVLKGGNAMDLIHQVGSRASLDLDFSMPGDFPEDPRLEASLERSLNEAFQEIGYRVIDFKLTEKPRILSEDLADFWGGYSIEFKVVSEKNYLDLREQPDRLRKQAEGISPSGSPRIEIDISKYEYCEPKETVNFEGIFVQVYTLEMIAAEKLRAICQQMEEYAPIVKRTRPGAPRARDFYDLHRLISNAFVNPETDRFRELIKNFFSAKKVPLQLLGKVRSYREAHRADFQSVTDTIKPGELFESFDYYFDFVCSICDQLEVLWND